MVFLPGCWEGEGPGPLALGDQEPHQDGEDHEAAHGDQRHAPEQAQLGRGAETKLDGRGHLLTRLREPVLGPEKRKNKLVSKFTRTEDRF